MKTQEAYNQYLVNAQNEANFTETVIWALFIVLVVVPLVALCICIPFVIYNQPRCPSCGSRRLRDGFTTTKKDGLAVMEPVIVCKRCHRESPQL